MYGLHMGADAPPCACKHGTEHAGDAGGPSTDDSIGVLPTLLLSAGVIVAAVAYRRHTAAKAQGGGGV